MQSTLTARRPAPLGRLASTGDSPLLTPVVAALVAAAPALVTLARLVVTHPTISFWGDQAAADIAARDTVTGHNLLGVYSRYGWHHPGPAWLAWLGVLRAVFAGSTFGVGVAVLTATVLACAASCAVAWRTAPTLLWPVAAAAAILQLDYGFIRMTVLWNPYAVALPFLVLLLVAVRAADRRAPLAWLAWLVPIGSAMVQADVSTAEVVAAVVVVAAAARLVPRGGPAPAGDRRPLAVAVVVTVALWAEPVWQQLTGTPGNLAALARFAHTHHELHHPTAVVRVTDTLLGLFPLRIDAFASTLDSTPAAMQVRIGTHPFLLAYLLAVAVVVATTRRRPEGPLVRRIALVWAAGLVGFVVSAATAYGPQYPYLFLWALPLATLAWVGAAVAVLAALPSVVRRVGPVVLAVAASVATVGASVPYATAAGIDEPVGRVSWAAVASQVAASGARVVEVDAAAANATPYAYAIVDAGIHHGLRMVMPPDQAAYLDPHVAAAGHVDLVVELCCSAMPGDTSTPLPGARVVGALGGYQVDVAPGP